MEDVTHQQIYDRLIAVESKVDHIDTKTEGIVKAFDAASGAFLVLEWIGKLAKPILWICASSVAVYAAFKEWTK